MTLTFFLFVNSDSISGDATLVIFFGLKTPVYPLTGVFELTSTDRFSIDLTTLLLRISMSFAGRAAF